MPGWIYGNYCGSCLDARRSTVPLHRPDCGHWCCSFRRHNTSPHRFSGIGGRLRSPSGSRSNFRCRHLSYACLDAMYWKLRTRSTVSYGVCGKEREISNKFISIRAVAWCDTRRRHCDFYKNSLIRPHLLL